MVQGDSKQIEEWPQNVDLAQHLLSLLGLAGGGQDSDCPSVVDNGYEVRRLGRHVRRAETLIEAFAPAIDHRHATRARHLSSHIVVVEIVFDPVRIGTRLRPTPFAALVLLACKTSGDPYSSSIIVDESNHDAAEDASLDHLQGQRVEDVLQVEGPQQSLSGLVECLQQTLLLCQGVVDSPHLLRALVVFGQLLG